MANKYRRRRNRQDQTLLAIVLAAFLLAAPLTTNNGQLYPVLTAIIVVVLIAGLGLLLYGFYRNSQRRKALRLLDLAAIDTMSGIDFERWVGEQLRLRGYRVTFTPVNDYGVDIVAKKNGITTAVQVKRYRKVLDQKPVREAVAGMLYYKASKSMVVTNSHFSTAAKVLATSNHCELIDRDKLAAWLSESNQQ